MREVSIVCDTAARFVIAKDVEGAALERAILTAQERIEQGSYPHPVWKKGAVLVQRSDCTTEARQAKWAEDFYDIDRAERRRRRFKKPQIEKDWEEMVAQTGKDTRAAKRAANAGRRWSKDGG